MTELSYAVYETKRGLTNEGWKYSSSLKCSSNGETTTSMRVVSVGYESGGRILLPKVSVDTEISNKGSSRTLKISPRVSFLDPKKMLDVPST